MSHSYTLKAGLSGALYFNATPITQRSDEPDSYVIDQSVLDPIFMAGEYDSQKTALNTALTRIDHLTSADDNQKKILKMQLCKAFVYKTQKLTAQQKALMDHLLALVIAAHSQDRQAEMSKAHSSGAHFRFTGGNVSRSTEGALLKEDNLKLDKISPFINHFEKNLKRLGFVAATQRFLEEFFLIIHQTLFIFQEGSVAKQFLDLYTSFYSDVDDIIFPLSGLIVNSIMRGGNLRLTNHPIAKLYIYLLDLRFTAHITQCTAEALKYFLQSPIIHLIIADKAQGGGARLTGTPYEYSALAQDVLQNPANLSRFPGAQALLQGNVDANDFGRAYLSAVCSTSCSELGPDERAREWTLAEVQSLIPLKTKEDRAAFLNFCEHPVINNATSEEVFKDYLGQILASATSSWQNFKNFFNPKMHSGARKYALYSMRAVFIAVGIASIVFCSVASAGALPAAMSVALIGVAAAVKIGSLAFWAQMTIMGVVATVGSTLIGGVAVVAAKGLRALFHRGRKNNSTPPTLLPLARKGSDSSAALTREPSALSRTSSSQTFYDERAEPSYAKIVTALARVELDSDFPFRQVVRTDYAGTTAKDRYFAMIIALGNQLAPFARVGDELPDSARVLLLTWRENMDDYEDPLAMIERDYKAAMKTAKKGVANWSTISKLFLPPAPAPAPAPVPVPVQKDRQTRVSEMRRGTAP